MSRRKGITIPLEQSAKKKNMTNGKTDITVLAIWRLIVIKKIWVSDTSMTQAKSSYDNILPTTKTMHRNNISNRRFDITEFIVNFFIPSFLPTVHNILRNNIFKIRKRKLYFGNMVVKSLFRSFICSNNEVRRNLISRSLSTSGALWPNG